MPERFVRQPTRCRATRHRLPTAVPTPRVRLRNALQSVATSGELQTLSPRVLRDLLASGGHPLLGARGHHSSAAAGDS